MKKLLYVLCALVFMACGDDDDKIVTDFDKPYSKQSSSELQALIEKNIDSYLELRDESAVYYRNVSDSLRKVFGHYGVPFFHFDVSDFISMVRASSTDPTPMFTGIKMEWNKEKNDFDTTVNAVGFLEVLLPSSTADGSKNDLHVIMNVNYGDEVILTWDVCKNGKLLFKRAQQYNEESGVRTDSREYPPYLLSWKQQGNSMKKSSSRVSRVMLTGAILAKEGGNSCSISMNLENDDLNMIFDYNNIRIRGKINQYRSLDRLMEQIDDTNEERYNQLVLELMQKNLKENVIVFTDRDEKIGEWTFIEMDDNMFLPVSQCTFKDGKTFRFNLDSLTFISGQ